MPDPILFAKAVIAAAVAGALVTLAVAAISAALLRAIGRQTPAASAAIGSFAGLLGISLGGALGFYILGDLPPRSLEGTFLHWSVSSVLDRFLIVIMPMTVLVELFGGFPKVPRWLVWILRFGLAVVVGRVLLHGSSYLLGSASDWTMTQVWTVLGLGMALLTGVWSLLARLVHRRPGISISLSLSLTCLAAGMTVMLSGYLEGGAVGLPLAAALAGAMIASVLLVRIPAGEGGLGVGLVGLFGVLFMGRFFGDLSTPRALIVFLAPLACWVSELPIVRRRRPWVIAAVRIMLVAAPLIVVLGLAKRDFDRAMAEPYAIASSSRGAR